MDELEIYLVWRVLTWGWSERVKEWKWRKSDKGDRERREEEIAERIRKEMKKTSCYDKARTLIS